MLHVLVPTGAHVQCPPPGIVRTLVEGVARFCPRAWLAIISNPVNSTVPIAAEVRRQRLVCSCMRQPAGVWHNTPPCWPRGHGW